MSRDSDKKNNKKKNDKKIGKTIKRALIFLNWLSNNICVMRMKI